MTRRADVVDRGVEGLHAGLTDVADLEARLAALVRGGNGAATAAEEAFSAHTGGFGEAGGAAVRAWCALCAFSDVGEALAVAVSAVGTQELSGEARSLGTVAAGGTGLGGGGVVQTVVALRADLRKEE